MYYSCFVSMCPSNSKRNPDKIFLRVPEDESRRREWFKVARVSYDISKYTKRYACGDHFDLERDVVNYKEWLARGGPKVISFTAIPHKFHGLPNRDKFYCMGPPPVPPKDVIKTKEETVFEDSTPISNEESSTLVEDSLLANGNISGTYLFSLIT